MNRIEIPAIFHELTESSNPRFAIDKPFVQEGRLFATDGRVLLRLRRPINGADDLGDKARRWPYENRKVVNAVGLIARTPVKELVDFLVIPDGLVAEEKCDHGDLVRMFDDARHAIDYISFCEDCDGTCVVRNTARVILRAGEGLAEIGFMAYYLAKLRAAGVRELRARPGAHDQKSSPAYFETPEFDGVLMPMLRPEWIWN